MKNIALLTGALCAIGSSALAQSTVIITPFQNRFGGIHEPVAAVHTINRSAAFERQTFGGGSTFTTDPAARGVVTSPTATASRQRLDPTVMNVPVFPGNTAILMQQGQFGGFGPFGVNTFPPNVGFGNTGVFMQQGGGGSQLIEVDPFRTSATPGPAVNAVPRPAAPVPTIPQLQPSTGTTVPVRQQIPSAVPQQVIVPGAVGPTGAGQNQNPNQNQGGQQPNQ